MKRRHPRGHRSIILVAAALVVGTAFLMAISAEARDRILPLKVTVGEKAPDFALPSADGKTVRLSDYAGHNVLIDFYRGYW